MLVAGYSLLVFFVLFAIVKSRLPDAGGGWSNPPIYDYVFILGFGICWSVLCVGYTYYAWTLNADDFLVWMKNQVIGRIQARKPVSKFARAYNQWFFRLVTPIGALLGIGMIGFMLFAITEYLLK